MFKLIYISIVIIVLSSVGNLNGYAQDQPRLCVYFKQSAKYIEIKLREDSTHTHFKIIRKGFETEEQRKKAWEEYRQDPFADELYPIFYRTFYSVRKPEKLTSIKEVDCVDLISLDEYRQKDFRTPRKARSDLVIFIQKLPDSTFLKWDVVVAPIE